ncbi:hypothetical protein EVAR_89294_1 [Eumeta japonica]|uniref:PiggyBac transposable element-derived protein domain-containing protein n=1 Tax=Eumeta variegata TaxID=151549 RepID=A0A4C1YZU2_EUMVA|nr:hypothetical protein EVAR_89294_1 [Eumeta japonica]
MDPRRFYGGIHTIVKDFPDSSADEDLSDDEQLTNRRRNVLPPLCIPESEGPVQSDTNLPKISTSSDVVVRLSRTIPEGLNYKLFFDNWYTSLPFDDLDKKYLPIGTIKANRIPGYKVPVEKILKKGRGTTVEKLTTIDNTDISVVTWRTLADSDPYLPLADFKCAVAEGLSQSNKPSTSGKRGRPSYELENAIEAKKLRGPIAIMPSRDVRLDQIDHMPLDH